MRILKRIVKVISLLLFLLFITVVILIWLSTKEKYQNRFIASATQYLSEKLHTKVDIKHVRFTFFNEFNLEGVYIADEKKDTLAYIGVLHLRTSELFSNYWNNQPPVLKHVLLEDAVVNMHRNKDSSRWNFDFIGEAFSSSGQHSEKDSLSAKDSGSGSIPQLDIKNIALKNIRFNMKDAWLGLDIHSHLPKLSIDVQEFDLPKKRIALSSLLLNDAVLKVHEYVRGKPETPTDSSDWGTPFNPDLFSLKVNDLAFENTSFQYDRGKGLPEENHFDHKHMAINHIRLHLTQTHVEADTIFSHMENLEATERCGLTIQSARADIKISQVESWLNQLFLQTNYSTIQEQYGMTYRNFHDFNDFIDRVTMHANLKNSIVDDRDIAYFASILREYPIAINLSGQAHGKLGDLSVKNMKASVLQTHFNGDVHVTGLPDEKKMWIDVVAKELVTSGSNLNQLIPQTKVEAIAWNDLKKIYYSGTYKGHPLDFNAKGILQTNLGDADMDMAMNLSGQIPTYSGSLQTTGFRLGTLIKQSRIGSIACNAVLSGQGFDLNTVKARVNGSISRLGIDTTTYYDMTINGLVENKKFDGIFISKDEKFAVNFNGKVDLSGSLPSYHFTSRFVRFNLQQMGITREPILGSGIATLHFVGDDIDNFTGTASLRNVTIENAGKKIHLKELDVQSYEDPGNKVLELKSSLADASLKGDYSISKLPSVVQMFFYHYLPQYIHQPATFRDQNFTFTARLKEVDTVLQTLFPTIHGLSNSFVDGYIDSKKQKLGLDITIPELGYHDLNVQHISVVSAGDFNVLDLNANTQTISYNGETVMPAIQINSSMANDTASLSINSQSVNEVLGDAAIHCKATALNNELFVHLLPSNLRIKDDNWQFYSGADLVFGEMISITDFMIENGAQRLTLNTDQTATNNLGIALNEIDLNGLSIYTGNPDLGLEGRISGLIHINDFTNNPLAHIDVYSTNLLRFKNDTLGELRAVVDYDIRKNNFRIGKSTELRYDNRSSKFNGQVNGEDSTLHLDADINHTSIAFINAFLSDYVQNLNGFATAKIQMNGEWNNPDISGNLELDKAHWKVLFTGASYNIKKAKLRFNNRKIEMDDFDISDDRKGDYNGLVHGFITHNNFNDFRFNIRITSDNLLCLKTKEADNELFYGYVPGKVNFLVTGPLNDITIDMELTPLKGSVFNLPINSKGDASSYDYIHFMEYGKNQVVEKTDKGHKSKVLFNLKINATTDALANIILDPNTGEEITAMGNGNIRLSVDLGNTVEMNGSYTIVDGRYNFNFRGILKRVFNIEEGSKITWNGDPLAAITDIKAIYENPKPLSLYPLVSNLQLDGSDLQEAKKAYRTFVPITITGPLNNADIKFDITQPDNKAEGTPAYQALDAIRKNEAELISQAGVILLLNNFKAPEGGIATGSYKQGAGQTVSDVITNAVSGEITNQFQNLTGLKNFNINVEYVNRTDAYALNSNATNQFSVSVTGSFFKDRVLVDFGNTIDVTRTQTGRNSNYAGDFKAQFLITEDGRLRLNTYRIMDPTIDGSSNTGITMSGLGISYRQTFNRFSDLFGRKKKKTDTLNKDLSYVPTRR